MKRFSLNSIGVLLGIVVYIAVGYILALLFGLISKYASKMQVNASKKTVNNDNCERA